jgi:hypothetical protein
MVHLSKIHFSNTVIPEMSKIPDILKRFSPFFRLYPVAALLTMSSAVMMVFDDVFIDGISCLLHLNFSLLLLLFYKYKGAATLGYLMSNVMREKISKTSALSQRCLFHSHHPVSFNISLSSFRDQFYQRLREEYDLLGTHANPYCPYRAFVFNCLDDRVQETYCDLSHINSFLGPEFESFVISMRDSVLFGIDWAPRKINHKNPIIFTAEEKSFFLHEFCSQTTAYMSLISFFRPTIADLVEVGLQVFKDAQETIREKRPLLYDVCKEEFESHFCTHVIPASVGIYLLLINEKHGQIAPSIGSYVLMLRAIALCDSEIRSSFSLLGKLWLWECTRVYISEQPSIILKEKVMIACKYTYVKYILQNDEVVHSNDNKLLVKHPLSLEIHAAISDRAERRSSIEGNEVEKNAVDFFFYLKKIFFFFFLMYFRRVQYISQWPQMIARFFLLLMNLHYMTEKIVRTFERHWNILNLP